MKRRHRILLGILFLGFAVLVRYAMRDMHLDVDLLREGLMRMPGLVMENLQMEREVSGDLWQVRVPYLDQEKDLVTIRSLDVRRQLKGLPVLFDLVLDEHLDAGRRVVFFRGRRRILS